MFCSNTTTSDYIFLIVTHECDRNCAFCVDKDRGKQEYITMENAAKAVQYCLDNDIKTITILGGEPTLHPFIASICSMIRYYGINIVMTTNYSKPSVVAYLDKFVSSFNISYYDQKHLPKQKDFNADLTLSKLLFKGGIDTREKLDNFIDKHQNDFNDLKFSTLTDINKFTHDHKDLLFLVPTTNR